MKERPILFSNHMVRAILGDYKTQTRRIIKPRGVSDDVAQWLHVMAKKGVDMLCPYGQLGDRLWVRETVVLERWDDEPKPPTDRPLWHYEPNPLNEYDSEYWLIPHYKATDPAPDLYYGDIDDNDDGEPKCKWTPSIYIPRWASRVLLEIVSVRAEHLQDIEKDENVNDVFEEGFYKPNYYEYADDEPSDIDIESAVSDFKELWNSINGRRGFGWDVNPWVWVIEFKRLEPIHASA
jgi:hypothetical protein